MKRQLKGVVRGCIPPILWRLLSRTRQKKDAFEGVHFQGEFPDWNAAVGSSFGYNDPSILEKVRLATLAVMRGEAAYERDSVTFSTPEFTWPVLSSLCHASTIAGERSLRVIDFGGSLGSTYFQHKRFLDVIEEVKWGVVEQTHYATIGQEQISDGRLLFFDDINVAYEQIQPQVLLLSSVLQYLPDPHRFLKHVLQLPWQFVVIDRTAFLPSATQDLLTVQHVPESIYKASYPAWFFCRQTFLNHFSTDYSPIADWSGSDSYLVNGSSTDFLGFLFRRIKT